jgi:hypothetical protein
VISASLRYSARISSELRRSALESSHSAFSARRPCRALHRFRLGGVEALQLAAEAGRVQHDGGQQAGLVDVLSVAGLAGRLGAAVAAGHAVGPDQGEVLGVLHLRGRGRLQPGGGRIELAEARAAAGAGVRDDAVLHRHLGGRDLPGVRGGLDEQGAGRGAGLSKLVPGLVDRRRAAGALHPQHGVGVELGVGGGGLDGDPVPVRVHLLGHDRGLAGGGALAELDVLGDHRDRPVRRDPDERPERPDVGLRRAEGHEVGLGAGAEQQAAADHGRADHQVAAGDLGGARAGPRTSDVARGDHGLALPRRT